MEQPLFIKFDPPRNGWLPVRFTAASVELEFHASDVLNDPLDELYRSIKRLVDNKTGEVTWWLEPYTYFFYFERTGPNDFRLTISEAPGMDDERRPLAILNGSYKQLIAPMRRALLEFCDYEYENTHWPFSYTRTDIETIPKRLEIK